MTVLAKEDDSKDFKSNTTGIETVKSQDVDPEVKPLVPQPEYKKFS